MADRTEVNVFYTDKKQSWFESAAAIQVFAWAELNGELVAGSKEVAQPTVVVQTNDVVADVNQAIKDTLEALTGDVAAAYSYPGAFADDTTFGMQYLSYGNDQKNRPVVFLASENTYEWGDLNIPERDAEVDRLVWKFNFYVTAVSPSASPAYNALQDYITENSALPVLYVLELNAQ